MSGPDPGEFEQIAALYRPLTRGAPEALDLLDDAAVIPQRPGFDLVITKDALVEGVHFLSFDPIDLVARKLLRVNLSDLAAKGAEPYGYFLAAAWPATYDWPIRQAFAEGLRVDGEAFGLSLLGGDTVSTTSLTFSVTMLGWVPAGGMIRRAGARVGDRILVSGAIGDGGLGLLASRGLLADADGTLVDRYRLPRPRLELRETLRSHATAAADVSDGLIADAGHIARASGTGLKLELDRLPLSAPAQAWLAAQRDRALALVWLASAGDDYEVVCTSAEVLPGFTDIGEVTAAGLQVLVDGTPVDAGPGGWRHA